MAALVFPLEEADIMRVCALSAQNSRVLLSLLPGPDQWSCASHSIAHCVNWNVWFSLISHRITVSVGVGRWQFRWLPRLSREKSTHTRDTIIAIWENPSLLGTPKWSFDLWPFLFWRLFFAYKSDRFSAFCSLNNGKHLLQMNILSPGLCLALCFGFFYLLWTSNFRNSR